MHTPVRPSICGSGANATIHTVAVVKNGRGFVAHNVNGSGRPSVPCESITELIRRINGGRARGIALIGVSCGTGGAPAEGCV